MTPQKIFVLGSGPYCIGSSVEFDWCGVQVLRTLRALGHQTIFLNSNPETVSTDFDECDRLYFDELTVEKVLDIVHQEQPSGVIFSTGGQVAQNMILDLSKAGVPLLGTAVKSIETCEDRSQFSQFCDQLGLSQPQWDKFSDQQSAIDFAEKVGYPVLVRPSFVLSGAAMAVAGNAEQLKEYLSRAVNKKTGAPSQIVLSKFEEQAKELEFDGVACEGEVIASAISEHIEHAGVHSGDATIVLPPQDLRLETLRRVRTLSAKIAAELKIHGPFNIQFLARDNFLKVIECNLRASRSFPFVSKVLGQNFIELSTRIWLGEKPKPQVVDLSTLDHVGVKMAQFSFSRLKQSDPNLGVEMSSTGEVGCLGKKVEEAFLKSLLAVGFRLPKKQSKILVTIGKITEKVAFLPSAKKLKDLGYEFLATPGTAQFLQENGFECSVAHKIQSEDHPNVMELLEEHEVSLVINTANKFSHEEISDGYLIRRQAIDRNIPLLTNLQLVKMLVRSLEWQDHHQSENRPYQDYFN